MQGDTFEQIFRNVPQDQKEQLKRFRSTHPYKRLAVAGGHWEYQASGTGEETLLLLPGGLRVGETLFQHSMAFENGYRVIVPTYPPVTTMAQLVDGIAAILEAEQIHKAHVLGISFGGLIAQSFVRRYPGLVDRLILSNTAPPDKVYANAYTHKLKMLLQALSALPFALVLFVYKRWLLKTLAAPSTEREFWRAYLNELLSFHTTKADLVSEARSMLDYAENYHFTRDDLKNWRGRILVLESDTDETIGASLREALKALYPQAQVHTFRNAGHTTYLSQREEYVSLVENFLRGRQPEHEAAALRG
jgi:pimeloyl-ACP methyl ester carboxylesterase